MPVVQGPWDHRPPGGGWPRVLVLLAILIAGTVGVWFLFRLLPGQTFSDWDWSQLVWLVAVLALVASAVLTGRRYKLRHVVRNIAIWMGVAAVLVVGYTFQDELLDIVTRIKTEFLPGSAVETSPHVMTLTQSDDGSFYVFGDVQGTQVKFLIDTGASDIVLSPSDARRAGIDMASLDYIRGFETANGLGDAAPVRLASLAVGPIRFTDVPAAVNRAEMRTSLLGMTFLRRLDGFEIRGRRMLLHWH